MNYTYEQRTGRFLGPDGALMWTGYSGLHEGKNNPDMENVPGKGPIPRGTWAIGKMYNSPKVGPIALPLTPVGFDPHGRSAFRIHGDSLSHPGEASDGCIIVSRETRQAISRGAVKTLVVVRG